MMINAKKQAFTLVELIVVITILAILGTIAFISLQGYSADARNSKRTQDLNNIAAAINIKTVQGSSLTSFVLDTTAATSFSGSIAGTGTTSDDFRSGTVNHTALGIKAEDFRDSTGDDYRIGATTKKNGQFELASIVENGSGSPTAAVNGTYNARQGTGAISTTINGNNLTLDNNTDIGSFFVGDFITVDGASSAVEVVRISVDGSTLTLASAPTAGSGAVLLANVEMGGLVEGTATGSIVTNNGSNLPY